MGKDDRPERNKRIRRKEIKLITEKREVDRDNLA